MDALIRRCGGMVNKRHIREQVKMLAEVGLIKRIVSTKDKNGNPLYTVPGRAPRFELPPLPAPPDCRCGSCEGGALPPPMNKGGNPLPLGGGRVPPYPSSPGRVEPEPVPDLRLHMSSKPMTLPHHCRTCQMPEPNRIHTNRKAGGR